MTRVRLPPPNRSTSPSFPYRCRRLGRWTGPPHRRRMLLLLRFEERFGLADLLEARMSRFGGKSGGVYRRAGRAAFRLLHPVAAADGVDEFRICRHFLED